MKMMIAGILPYIFATAGSMLTGLVPWGFALLKKYTATKTNNALVENALTRISHTVETVVAELIYAMVKSLTEKTADGRISGDDLDKIKADALTNVKELIPAAILDNARLGITDLDTWITKKINQAVGKVEASTFPVYLVSGGTASKESGQASITTDGAVA